MNKLKFKQLFKFTAPLAAPLIRVIHVTFSRNFSPPPPFLLLFKLFISAAGLDVPLRPLKLPPVPGGALIPPSFGNFCKTHKSSGASSAGDAVQRPARPGQSLLFLCPGRLGSPWGLGAAPPGGCTSLAGKRLGARGASPGPAEQPARGAGRADKGSPGGCIHGQCDLVARGAGAASPRPAPQPVSPRAAGGAVPGPWCGPRAGHGGLRAELGARPVAAAP